MMTVLTLKAVIDRYNHAQLCTQKMPREDGVKRKALDPRRLEGTGCGFVVFLAFGSLIGVKLGSFGHQEGQGIHGSKSSAMSCKLGDWMRPQP